MSKLTELLTEHYYDAKWSKEHQGFRCVCGWLGEDHVAHVAEVLTGAGFIHLKQEKDREFVFSGDEADEVWVDKP